MRVLLDTNIIIYRENKKMTNYSIGHLFRWLDKLKYDKLIHPLTKKEIAMYKYADPAEAMTLKLDAYQELKTQAPMAEQVAALAADVYKRQGFPLTPAGSCRPWSGPAFRKCWRLSVKDRWVR